MENEHFHEDIGRLREIAQQGTFQQTLQLYPLVKHVNEQQQQQTMNLFQEILLNHEQGERNFQDLVEEFIQLIEQKLADAEYQMFDGTAAIRASSPTLFDMLNDLKTCRNILCRTEIQSLFNAFDNILKLHLYPAALPDAEDIHSTNNSNETKLNNSETTEELLKLSQYAIDELKIVKIEKNHEPLGLTISRSDSGTIHIARIVIGGLAANTQLFQINDRILEINDEPVTGRSLDYICSLMSSTTGLTKFLLAPPIFTPLLHNNQISYQTFYVRALYAYDPYNDPLIPCKELGLQFQRGDILRIVARDENLTKINDSYVSWWQAYREDSTETDTDPCLAGLIPSDSLQQKRADLIKAVSDETESISSSSSSSYYRRKMKKKHSKCLTCVPKRERKVLQPIYNNASFIRDIDDIEPPPTIRTSTNHFSLTDTRHFGEEQPAAIINDENKHSTIDSAMFDVFRFYEPVFRFDFSVQKMTRPIILLGKILSFWFFNISI